METKKHKIWTEEEDAILLNAVKDCPNNLSLAFVAASELTGRTVGSCSNHWYTVISKRTDKNSIALVCVSGKTYGVNRKNCKTPKNTQDSTAFSRIWRTIVNFFGV